jgi:hypothetical protein
MRMLQDSERTRMSNSYGWVAHASRVLAILSRDRELFLIRGFGKLDARVKKACFGATPKPTRETRALPGHAATRI